MRTALALWLLLPALAMDQSPATRRDKLLEIYRTEASG